VISSRVVLANKTDHRRREAGAHNHQRLSLNPIAAPAFANASAAGCRFPLMRSLSSDWPEAGRKYSGNHVVEPPGTTYENRHSPCDEEIEKGVASQNVTVQPDFDSQCWTQADQGTA
jgi:hypothetical protein